MVLRSGFAPLARSVAGLVVVAGCVPSFDAKRAAEEARGHDSQTKREDEPPRSPARATTTPPPPSLVPEGCASTAMCAEPFTVAAVAEVDAFPGDPVVELPAGAKLAFGQYESKNGVPDPRPHEPHVFFDGGLAAFEREVLPPVRAASRMPEATTLAYRWSKAFERTDYHVMVLREPPLVKTSDIATARAVEATDIHLINSDGKRTSTETKVYRVEIKLQAPATERLAAFSSATPNTPVAHLVHGRVIALPQTVGASGAKSSIWVGFPWLPPGASEATAEAFLRALRARGAEILPTERRAGL